MGKSTTYISIGDFLDVYMKIKQRGFPFLLSKLKLLPKSRIASKWDSYVSTSDFWIIPEIQQKWNAIISGNPETIYEEYVFDKYLKGNNDLKMLSIGCGEGLHERNFAKHNCFKQIDAIDFSPESIRVANELAIENNFKINYFSGDFKKHNFESEYDLILFSSSLHHFEDIDTTLSNHVKPLLKENGFLVIFEYTGPNRLQWTKDQLIKANELLKKIPKNYKLLTDNKTRKKKVYRPGLFRMLLVDPSEAVDSESIISSLQKHFKIIEQKNLGWNILHLLLKGIAHNFLDEKPETKQIIQDLINEEMKFIEENNKTDAIFGVYKK
jgi:ubiquinone/menaquinone biosynthesis C-methylase UbiE